MMQCPRCKVVYAVYGAPPKNPGGLGAETGWNCLFCCDEPPRKIKEEYAKRVRSVFAQCSRPVYLKAYAGSKMPDFELVRTADIDAEDVGVRWERN